MKHCIIQTGCPLACVKRCAADTPPERGGNAVAWMVLSLVVPAIVGLAYALARAVFG